MITIIYITVPVVTLALKLLSNGIDARSFCLKIYPKIWMKYKYIYIYIFFFSLMMLYHVSSLARSWWWLSNILMKFLKLSSGKNDHGFFNNVARWKWFTIKCVFVYVYVYVYVCVRVRACVHECCFVFRIVLSYNTIMNCKHDIALCNVVPSLAMYIMVFFCRCVTANVFLLAIAL